MSLIDQQTPRRDGAASGLSPESAPFAARAPHPAPDTRAPSTPAAGEALGRHPKMSVPIGKGRRMSVFVDRVRAKPAVSPSLSMNLGVGAVALGFWGALFPHHLKRTLGVGAPALLVRPLFGARELWTGFALAGDPTRNQMLWVRVAGDVFDIVALRALDRPGNPKRGTARKALGLVALITAMDVIAAVRLTGVKRNCIEGRRS